MLRAIKVISGSYIHMNFYSTVLAPTPLLWCLNEETEAFEHTSICILAPELKQTECSPCNITHVLSMKMTFHWNSVPIYLSVTPIRRSQRSSGWVSNALIIMTSQIPQCTCPISHNAPRCNRNVHTCAHFCYNVVHCGIFDTLCDLWDGFIQVMPFSNRWHIEQEVTLVTNWDILEWHNTGSLLTYRSAEVIMIVADALAPNSQAIRSN